MFLVSRYTSIEGYLYAAVGVTSCFVLGLLASPLLPGKQNRLAGLTLFTMRDTE